MEISELKSIISEMKSLGMGSMVEWRKKMIEREKNPWTGRQNNRNYPN